MMVSVDKVHYADITHPFHMLDKNGSQDKIFLGSVTFKIRKKRYHSLDKHKEEACIRWFRLCIHYQK